MIESLLTTKEKRMLTLKTNFLLFVSLISLSLFAGNRSTTQYDQMTKQVHEKMSIIEVKMNRLEVKLNDAKDNVQEELSEQYDNLVELKNNLNNKISKAKAHGEEKFLAVKSDIDNQITELDKKLDKLTK